MGMFNTVTAPISCGYCHTMQSQPIQFKYGRTYQIEYQLGDLLDWRSRLVVGRFWPGIVIVRGIADDCNFCHHYGKNNQEWWCYVVINCGHIVAAETATWPVMLNEDGYVECSIKDPEQG